MVIVASKTVIWNRQFMIIFRAHSNWYWMVFQFSCDLSVNNLVKWYQLFWCKTLLVSLFFVVPRVLSSVAIPFHSAKRLVNNFIKQIHSTYLFCMCWLCCQLIIDNIGLSLNSSSTFCIMLYMKGRVQERPLDFLLKSKMAKTAPNFACQFVYSCFEKGCPKEA